MGRPGSHFPRSRPLESLSVERGRPGGDLRSPPVRVFLHWRFGTGDPILKERMFGLTGHEGNHGEDLKEYYFYLDSTPRIPT